MKTTSHSNASFDVERINAIPISKVAERYSDVRRSGCRKVTRCPWHDDEHPSLTLYETSTENRCYCFACGGGGSVIDYVMQQEHVDFRTACGMLSNDFGIPTVNRRSFRHLTPRMAEQKPIEYTYIPMSVVEDMVTSRNSFCQCLRQLFGRDITEHLTGEYLLGCYESWKYPDCVAFPNIDEQGRVHNIKVQYYEYDRQSEAFAHCDKNHILWLGSQLVKEKKLPDGSIFDNDCLFGQHLLRRYPQKSVALVESPKNTLFGAAAMPEFIWVATGNKSQLKRSTMTCLRGRKVVVYPDRDAITDWEQTLAGMADIAVFQVSHFCEEYAPESELKYDIADYLLDYYSRKP